MAGCPEQFSGGGRKCLKDPDHAGPHVCHLVAEWLTENGKMNRSSLEPLPGASLPSEPAPAPEPAPIPEDHTQSEDDPAAPGGD